MEAMRRKRPLRRSTQLPVDAPRVRAHTGLDARMRLRGWVTAQEVADALGMYDASGVRKGIEAGRIPGQRIGGLGPYGRWYVDVKALLASLPPGYPAETRAALRALVALVGEG